MTERERTIRLNRMIHQICLWEMRQGGKYYDAVLWTHRPGGPRQIAKEQYGPNSAGSALQELHDGMVNRR